MYIIIFLGGIISFSTWHAKKYYLNNILETSHKYPDENKDSELNIIHGHKIKCLITNIYNTKCKFYGCYAIITTNYIHIVMKEPYIKKISICLPKKNVVMAGYKQFSNFFLSMALIEAQDNEFVNIRIKGDNEGFSLYVPKQFWHSEEV